jgi:hypothetical protein
MRVNTGPFVNGGAGALEFGLLDRANPRDSAIAQRQLPPKLPPRRQRFSAKCIS